MIIIKNKSYIYFTILFFFVVFFKIFENFYIISKYDYETRLTKNYGYCEKSSYGFVKYIEKKYKLEKNINIINDEIHPSSEIFIYKPKRDYYKNSLILLNYDDQNSKIDIKNYSIIEKFKNCLYLEKND
tara:strand:- start:224 stop:610 length:387 start_codon:yes stop_codon:yes gene_type:complete